MDTSGVCCDVTDRPYVGSEDLHTVQTPGWCQWPWGSSPDVQLAGEDYSVPTVTTASGQ